MSLVFGITGSIAVGKSAVTRFMRRAGIPVIDADVVAREVVEVGTNGLAQLVEEFGTEYLLPNGTLDRPKLGKLVFEDQNQLDHLNNIMFPLVKVEARKQIQELVDNGTEILAYDSALLIETGQTETYRPLVVVSTTPETQMERLMRRNDLTEAEARSRISRQLTSEEKEKYADYVIRSNGTLDELEQNVLSVLSDIKSTYYSQK